MSTPHARATTPTLTAQQRDELVAALRAKRHQIQGRRRAAADDRILEDEPDPMDAATGLTTEAESSGLALQDVHILREVDDALRRVDEGTYGTSEESGEPIGYERLRAVPWARRTILEEERREARLR